MPAGNLRDRIEFARRVSATDAYGNTLGDWGIQFRAWARKQYLRGGEQVMASRLDGRQPVVLTIRRSSVTDQIGTDWKARDINTDETWNIRSISKSEDRLWLDLLCESGVPAG